ncbi:MAG: hypothetical protein K5876_08075 [Ruminiclostridium sp.]|nr:hypothetical protein [Ruminiclostridium sp.]
MAKRNPALHAGHRKRMKEQFLENGLSQFNDHQKLELLLFYAQPRGDTNELAHRILEECGGKLHNVLDAPYRKLISIKGVSAHTATFLKLLPETASYYSSSKSLVVGESLAKEADDVCRYFEGVFMNVTREEIHAMAVGDKLRVLKEQKISDGNAGDVLICPKALMSFAIENCCDRIIIAHNHPNGAALASKDDILTTKRLIEVFSMFDIEIADHIVVGKNGSQSMRMSLAAGSLWKDKSKNPAV